MKKIYCDYCGNKIEYSYNGFTFAVSISEDYKYTGELLYFTMAVTDSKGNASDICKHCALIAIKRCLPKIEED